MIESPQMASRSPGFRSNPAGAGALSGMNLSKPGSAGFDSIEAARPRLTATIPARKISLMRIVFSETDCLNSTARSQANPGWISPLAGPEDGVFQPSPCRTVTCRYSASSKDHRNSFRMTSFKPDQISLTAQTFMSTNPRGKANSRMVSSVISVGTFEAFFGHDTHMAQSLLTA